ncbi:MAG: hypothetical protein LBD88_05130 [Candidatus Peribacteria bacterium]|nr:hypothetical protein [Candidatus Peribacteria bacterium]
MLVFWEPIGDPNTTTEYWVVDQNYSWSGNPGGSIVKKHKGNTTTSAFYTNLTNYYVVEY